MGVLARTNAIDARMLAAFVVCCIGFPNVTEVATGGEAPRTAARPVCLDRRGQRGGSADRVA